MSKQSTDWIYVRDGEGHLCWHRCSEWDRFTMLAALSSDPRSVDELAAAWSRYRPDSPLMEREWNSTLPPPPDGTDWLWLDLEKQRYACHEAEPTSLFPGSFQRDDGPWMPGNPVVWLNIPPWWRAEPANTWPVAAVADELKPQLNGTGISGMDQLVVVSACGGPSILYKQFRLDGLLHSEDQDKGLKSQ